MSQLTLAQRAFQSPFLAAAYDRFRESPASWLTCGMTFGREAALHSSALAAAPGPRWLEVACGQGSFGLAALRSVDGARLVGLDLSAAQLRRAGAKSRQLGLSGRHRRVRGDALRLPFADGSFHAVLCVGGLHQIPEPARAVREMARVLVPGGVLAGAAFVLRPRWSEPVGMNPITVRELRTWLGEAGLDDLRLGTTWPIWCVFRARRLRLAA